MNTNISTKIVIEHDDMTSQLFLFFGFFPPAEHMLARRLNSTAMMRECGIATNVLSSLFGACIVSYSVPGALC
jgi:hypothetical protein